MPETPEEKLTREGPNALVKYLLELEKRIVALEQSMHPDQIAEAAVKKIASHLHGAVHGHKP